MPPVRWQVTQLSISIGAICSEYETFAPAFVVLRDLHRAAARGDLRLLHRLAGEHGVECAGQQRVTGFGFVQRAAIRDLPALRVDDQHFAGVRQLQRFADQVRFVEQHGDARAL